MLIKNSIIYGIMSIVRGVLAFLVVTIYTRLLSPSEYGDYAVLIALVGFTDSLVFMSVRHAIMRNITHAQKDGDHAYLMNAVFVYVLGSLACLAVFFFLTGSDFFNNLEHKNLYSFLGFMVASEAFSQLVIIMARIRLQNILFFSLNIMRSIISVCAGAILIGGGLGVMGAVYSFLLSASLSCVVGVIGTPDFRKLRIAMLNSKIMRDIVAFGLPLVFVLSVQSAVFVTDRLMLDHLIGGDVVGLYSAAQDIPTRLINMLIVSIHVAAYQLAVHKLDHEGEEACKAQLRQNYMLLLGVGLPATVGMIVLAPGLANVLLGLKFRPFFIDYIVFFAPMAFMNSFLQHYFVLSFNFAKKNHMMIVPFTGALAINAVLGYFGIYYLGVEGAILGAFAAYVFLIAMTIVLARDIFRMPVPFVPTVQIAAATFLMAVIVRAADFGGTIFALVASAIIGAAVYAGAIYGFNTGNIRTEIGKFIDKKRRGMNLA